MMLTFAFTFLNILLVVLAFLLLYIVFLLIASWIGVSAKEDKPELSIYILSNGAHTDLVIPTKNTIIDWTKDFPTENTKGAQQDYDWLAIGWGDKGFYLEIPTWADLTPRIAFRAVLGLSTSAIHATYYKHIEEHAKCKKISMSQRQYEVLVNYVKLSLEYDAFQKPILIQTDAVYGNSDAFYEAKGSYNLFFTCNTWANQALKACGQKAALWTIFPKGIFWHYH